MAHVQLGSISHGTMRPEDLIPDFVSQLQSLDTRGDYAELVKEADAIEDFDSEDAGYVLEELFDALNTFAPDYCYFGAHPGDGADYGFWLCEEWEQMARDDGVLFVEDTADIPADFAGGLVCHVNDHGNATLYAQDHTGARREIWSVV